MKKAIIIVAAGSGSRMGMKVPKQYLQLRGKPIIVHTLELFRLFDPEIKTIVVLAPGHLDHWKQVEASYESARGLITTSGGDRRYDSVKKGLDFVDQKELVGIHDAVRPLVSQATLDRCFNAAELEGSGIPVIEMDESVRMLENQAGSRHLDRSRLRRVQTPQVFRSERIKEAYRQAFHPDFTDDASVYETRYGPVTLVEGNRENIKITTPLDLQLAGLLMASPD
jgi:2-C-methyl-D-erythritol 4-phosphate cytidylyltransferase